MKNELMEIMSMFALAADINIKAQRRGQLYTEKHCPFKVGQKLIVNKLGNKINVVIKLIHFDEHGGVEGMAHLQVQPKKKDWTTMKGRNNFTICHDEDIIRIVE